MLASELGQASLTVALVGSPLARWIASQAPAFDAGVLDSQHILITLGVADLPQRRGQGLAAILRQSFSASI